MPGVYTKTLLSGSLGGEGIQITATSTPGTLIHQTDVSASFWHEIHIDAVNVNTVEVLLTVQYGNTAVTGNIQVKIPPQQGLHVVVPGSPLVGTGSAVRSVRAFASITESINIFGWVNRINIT